MTLVAYVLGSKVIASVPWGTGLIAPGGVQFNFQNSRSMRISRPAFVNARCPGSRPAVRALTDAPVVSAPRWQPAQPRPVPPRLIASSAPSWPDETTVVNGNDGGGPAGISNNARPV